MRSKASKELDITNQEKWSVDQLRGLYRQIDEEISARANARAQQRGAASLGESLKSFEQRLMQEIQDYERGRRAGVIRV